MKKFGVILIGIVLLSFAGCTQKGANDSTIAEKFVQSKGYSILERNGQVQKYVLEESLLSGAGSVDYQQAWGVQSEKPDKYFGKEITVYGFVVKNHPLENIEQKYTQNGVKLSVMMAEGKVIGGCSYPNAFLAGAWYSLDGETVEEVTGLSFQQWQENWKKSYGS